MTVTDEPMPGVAQPGDVSLWVLARKDLVVTLLTTFPLEKFEDAKATAFSFAARYDETIVVDGTILYRAWQKGKK